MTDWTLDEAKALLAAATPGPWFTSIVFTNEFDTPWCAVGPYDNEREPTEGYPWRWSVEDTIAEFWGAEHDCEANAAFVAAAPSLVAWLISEVERSHAENEKWLTEALEFKEWNARVAHDNEIAALRTRLAEARQALAEITTSVEEALAAYGKHRQVLWTSVAYGVRNRAAAAIGETPATGASE